MKDSISLGGIHALAYQKRNNYYKNHIEASSPPIEETKKIQPVIESEHLLPVLPTVGFIDFTEERQTETRIKEHQHTYEKAVRLAPHVTTIISEIVQHPIVILGKKDGMLQGVALDGDGQKSANANWYEKVCKNLNIPKPPFHLMTEVSGTPTTTFITYGGRSQSESETMLDALFSQTEYKTQYGTVKNFDEQDVSRPFQFIVNRQDGTTDFILLAYFNETRMRRNNPGFISINLPNEQVADFTDLLKQDAFVAWSGILGRAFHKEVADIMDITNNTSTPIDDQYTIVSGQISRQQLFMPRIDKFKQEEITVISGIVKPYDVDNPGQATAHFGYNFKTSKLTFPTFIPEKISKLVEL